ncbi:uncharacterized protein LOC111085118 [Limulus polyphemus]|uniref:Uncharacterized protein LOC111085118 n=1 Tax=Limulus polyphemus TaxID=6850 RepID=A0ABM1S365_LIMPO|nr:uncharacterized protein LOC111085118 [Limulus polyphemus]XP_022238070.1 uncharacterized protein LOC111085118 [Limulus polyphemus]XP_022238071.1 uncharacterized protein LOC111085118 [Limulus polyphemus]
MFKLFVIFVFQSVKCEHFSPVYTHTISALFGQSNWLYSKYHVFPTNYLHISKNNDRLQQLTVTNHPSKLILDPRGFKNYFKTKRRKKSVAEWKSNSNQSKTQGTYMKYEELSSQSHKTDLNNLNNITSVTNKKKKGINKEVPRNFFAKVHAVITRSKEAVWAFIALTFLCVLLAVAVACSRMWKDYHGISLYQPISFDLNEKVPFKEALGAKLKFLRWLKRRQEWRTRSVTEANFIELEELLTRNCDSDDEI